MTSFISTTNCYIFKDNKILMLERSPNKKRFPNYFMGPGGKQELNESIFETCKREVKEETGLDIQNIKLKIIASHHYPHNDTTYLVFIFAADYLSGELINSDDGELKWMEKEEILQLEKLYPDLKYHLPILFENQNQITYTFCEFDKETKVIDFRKHS